MSLPQILLIDDGAEEGILLKRALKQIRCPAEVIHTQSPDAALRWLVEIDEPPHLILVDVNMPGVDGFSMVEHLSRVPEWSDIPTIFFTGSDQPFYRRQAQQTHARALFVKPDSFKGYLPLARTFRELVAQRRMAS